MPSAPTPAVAWLKRWWKEGNHHTDATALPLLCLRAGPPYLEASVLGPRDDHMRLPCTELGCGHRALVPLQLSVHFPALQVAQ